MFAGIKALCYNHRSGLVLLGQARDMYLVWILGMEILGFVIHVSELYLVMAFIYATSEREGILGI